MRLQAGTAAIVQTWGYWRQPGLFSTSSMFLWRSAALGDSKATASSPSLYQLLSGYLPRSLIFSSLMVYSFCQTDGGCLCFSSAFSIHYPFPKEKSKNCIPSQIEVRGQGPGCKPAFFSKVQPIKYILIAVLLKEVESLKHVNSL